MYRLNFEPLHTLFQAESGLVYALDEIERKLDHGRPVRALFRVESRDKVVQTEGSIDLLAKPEIGYSQTFQAVDVEEVKDEIHDHYVWQCFSVPRAPLSR